MTSQGVPSFFVKLRSFLRCSIEAGAHLSVGNKYILVRDATFFVVDFFTRIVLRISAAFWQTTCIDLKTRRIFT